MNSNEDILTALSEMIRSMSRILNNNPNMAIKLDIERLANAKNVLKLNTSINENEIPKIQHGN